MIVAVMGCSNSRDIELAYRSVVTKPVTINAAQAGGSILKWATVPSYWQLFDDVFDPNSDFVWWPVCIHVGDEPSLREAWNDFELAVALLRERTSIPLWLSHHVGTQPDCNKIRQSWMLQLVQRAVDQGVGFLALPEIPSASHPLGNDCVHFDPIQSTNVGDAAASFLLGLSANDR